MAGSVDSELFADHGAGGKSLLCGTVTGWDEGGARLSTCQMRTPVTLASRLACCKDER